MHRKDYVKAAEITRHYPQHAPTLRRIKLAIEDAFVELFRGDNPSFDEARFRTACKLEK